MMVTTGFVVAPAVAEGLPLQLSPTDSLEKLRRVIGDRVPLVEPTDLAYDMVLPPDIQGIVDGNFEMHTFVVNAGDTLTFSNMIKHVTEDWQVFGTVNFVNTELIFDGNFIVTVENSGTFTMSGTSSIHDLDDDRFTGGTIRATGNLDIQGTAAQKISSRSTSIISLPRGNSDFATSVVRHVDFRDSRAALSSGNSAGLYEFNRFLNNDRGMVVLGRLTTTGAGNPTVQHNAFVGNSLAVAIAGPSNPNTPNTAGKGQILNNEFQGNAWGVRCSGAPHTGDNTKPFISANNFRNHYGEAYGGTTGVTVTVGAVTQSLIADSVCTVDGNFFATGETTWAGGGDTIQNNQANPVANNAPAIAAADQPEVITTSVTKNNPTLTRPLIVDDNGVLTITGTINANGFLWGSGTGGRLDVDGPLTVLNNGQLIIRNDNDQVNKLQIDGPSKRLTFFGLAGVTTMHALLYRNSAALSGWTATNVDHLISLTNGLSRDATPATPSIDDFTVTNINVAVFCASMQVSVTDSTFTNVQTATTRCQLGTTTFNNNVADINQVPTPDLKVHGLGVINTYNADGNTLTGGELGIVSAIGNVASQNNKYHGIDNALQDVLGTLTSANDEIDGGLIGVLTSQNTNTITSAMIAQQNFGILSILDVSYSIATSTFAYNAYGVANAITASITVSNSNFRDNYQYALLGVPVALDVDVLGATAITCTNCFFFRDDDKAWSDGGGTITVTEAAVANAAPDPPWLASVLIAGPGETKVVSGTLGAPAIAREDGRLLIDGNVVNGLDRFVMGAKTGGNAGGDTGHITIRDSTLTDVRFISVHDTASVIERNHFVSSVEFIELTHFGMTIECNSFEDVALPVNWMRQGTGTDDLVFQRNLMDAESGGVDGGLADTDAQVSHILNNGYLNAAPLTANFAGGLFDRFQPGHVEFRGNNLLAAEGLNDMNFGSLSTNFPDAVDAANNWWNDANGPSVWRLNTDPTPDVLVNTRVGGAAIITLQDDDVLQVVPQPGFTPWNTAANAITPCVTFGINPPNPTEIDIVTFSDNSIAPDGSGIASRTWNFGDGTPPETTTSATITHDYADGGTTVTLTVQTGSGQTATASKNINVAHVNPIADFAAAVTNEITPVAFTDTSTHPNSPQDDPPTGWTYSWNFNGEGSSSLRNPSFRFADGGSKSVTLTVIDNDGKSDVRTRTLLVPHVAPIADFTFSPASPQETDTVQLTDASSHPNAPTDSITSASWSCSDGFTSTATNPSHKFPDGGTFTCTRTVGDNDAQTSSVIKSIAIGHVAPLADYNFSPSGPTELTTVQYTDTSSHPNPGDAPPTGWTFEWDFNGEGSSGQRNPTFNFLDGGSKSVTLTVTDNDAKSAFVTRTVPISHVPPVADFTFSPNAPDPGVLVTFTSTSFHPNAPVDAIVSQVWGFGDASGDTGASVTHAYAADGSFTVTLTVEDDDGLVVSVSKIVSVGNKPPVAILVISPSSPTDLDLVTFDASASFDPDGSIASYDVDYGDLSPHGTSAVTTHTYADDGVFVVVLTVTDNKGTTDSVAVIVDVANVAPSSNFEWSPKLLLPGDTAHFQQLASDPDGLVVAFEWDFGDGSAHSTAPNPSHTYANSGLYKVTLTVMDDDGAAASKTRDVCVTGVFTNQSGGGVQAGFCSNATLEDVLNRVLP